MVRQSDVNLKCSLPVEGLVNEDRLQQWRTPCALARLKRQEGDEQNKAHAVWQNLNF